MKIQKQYDALHQYFKTTSEAYDDLDWDGEVLVVVLDEIAMEKYTYRELQELIPAL